MFIFFCDRFTGFHWFGVRNLCAKYCCKSLNKRSSGVQERINPFYINSYGENSFGLRTTFRNELSSWTEVWLHMYFRSYLVQFFLEWEMFQIKVVEKIKTHILCSFLNRSFYEITWKNIAQPGRSQVTICRVRIACWIPKITNIHTLRICKIYCFSTATMAARTRLNITFYAHRLPCLKSEFEMT